MIKKISEKPVTEGDLHTTTFQVPEAGSEDALLLEKTRLELIRRKELALIEMQRIVAKSRKDKDSPIRPNVKS